jgi:hypothetical protein
MQKDYTLKIRKTIIFIELINGYQKAASYSPTNRNAIGI